MRFPEEILRDHIAVFGKTGSGKTSTGKLIVEQVVPAGARVCVLDPIKSDWWGLTSMADGKRAGLPFTILGGPRGHVPLHDGAGAAIAHLVATGALPLSIIDMAHFKSGGMQRFFVPFAETLWREMRGVLYLVIEEAHEFAPKERFGIGNENESIHWMKKLATGGRTKGIRLLVLSQRTQALHNAVIGSCETVIAHRMTHPDDQKPVLNWFKGHVPKDRLQAISESLGSLPKGTGWFCSGEAGIIDKMEFPKVTTFDNTKTPTGKETDVEVVTAPIDQAKLREVIGDAVQEAEGNDPKALKARVADLERQIEGIRPRVTGHDADPNAGRAEGFRDGWQAGYGRCLADFAAEHQEIARVLEDWARGQEDAVVQARRIAESKLAIDEFRVPEPDLTRVKSVSEVTPSPPAQRVMPMIETAITRSPPPGSVLPPLASWSTPARTGGAVPKNHQALIDALAWLEAIKMMEADKTQLAMLADMSPTSGSYFKSLADALKGGLITYPTPGKVSLSEAGRALANRPSRPPTTADIHEAIKRKLPAATWDLLQVLINNHPRAIEKVTLAKIAKQSPTSGSYFKALSDLKKLGLIEYPQPGHAAALPVLFV